MRSSRLPLAAPLALVAALALPVSALAQSRGADNGQMAPQNQMAPQDDDSTSLMITAPSFSGIANNGGGAGTPDNMGNHSATQDLSMNGYNITGIGEAWSSAYWHSSDLRLKTDIQPLIGVDVRFLLQDLEPVRFIWTDTGRPAMGFIAQDVQEIAPDLVSMNPETGMFAVDYTQLVPALVLKIQELESRVNMMEFSGLDRASAPSDPAQ